VSAKDYFSSGCVLLDLEVGNKAEIIELMVTSAAENGTIKRGKAEEVIKKVMAREEVGSTGIGRGVAVPHAKCSAVKGLTGLFARTKKPIDFNALDGQPVDLIFLLLSPEPSSGDHLGVLAIVARIARDELYCRFLRQAKTPEEAVEVLEEAMQSLGG